jgi:hypothetical protein
MSMSFSRSIFLCSVFASTIGLSACSTKDPADVSFEDIDRTKIPTNVVVNDELNDSNTQWTGWTEEAEATNGAFANFAIQSGAPGGNSLKVSQINVEAANSPKEIQAGPAAVPVTPGKSYGVGAWVKGSTCGLGKFVVHPANDPETILASQEMYFTGDWQTLDYYFNVPAGVTSVNLPLQLAFADNLGGEVQIDKMIAFPRAYQKPPEAGNVARNSDFEGSNTEINVPENGTNSWAQAGSATFTLDTTVAQSGKNSVKIKFAAAGTGNPWDIEAGPVNVPVSDGLAYTFSGWVKADKGSAGAKVNFLIQNPTAYNVFAEKSVSVTEEWQEVRFNAVITGTNVVRLYAQYNFTENSNKTIYIDNLKLIPPATCPYAPVFSNLVSKNESLFESNRVTNGNFESSDKSIFPGWSAQAVGTAKATFEGQTIGDTNKTLVNSGKKSLKTFITTVGTNPQDIQAGSGDLYVAPGKTYTYSAFGRGPIGTKALFTAELQAAPNVVIEGQWLNFNNLWQQVSFDFVVPADAPVLTTDELAAAGLPSGASLARMRMAVNLSYPENAGKPILLDDFALLANLAANGDLENSSTSAEGWFTQSPNGAEAFALDSTQAQSGKNSLKLSPAALASGVAAWEIQAGIANIAITENRKYIVSARVKGDAGTKAKLALGLADAPYTELAASDLTLTTEWQEVTFEAKIPSGVNKVTLAAHLGYPENANKAVYLDSFRLVQGLYPSSDLVSDYKKLYEYNRVTNGGFESSTDTFPGWLAQTGNSADVKFETQAAGTANKLLVYSGSKSLKAAITAVGSNSWDIQAGPADLYLTPGQTYIYSGFARSALGAKANFSAALQNAPYSVFEEQQVAFNNTWQQVTFEFTLPADAPVLTEEELSAASLPKDAVVSRVRMAVNMSYPENAGKTIYLDDFALLPNSVVNGDLENNATVAEGWWSQASSETATFALDSTQAHSGKNSLKVSTSALATDIKVWDLQAGVTGIPVAGGRKYYVSARIKGDAGAKAKFLLNLGEAPYTEFGTSEVTLTSGWQEVSFEAKLPDGINKVSLLAQLGYAQNASKTIYLDGFKVVSQVPPPKTQFVNLVANGGLETGSVTGWNGSGAAKLALATSASAPAGVYTGGFGLHVTERAETWNSAQYSFGEAGLESGTSYLASAWVKVDGETADNIKLTLQITYTDDSNEWIGLASTGSADTLGWTKLSSLFNFAPDAAKKVKEAKVYIEADGKNTSYYIDDLYITKVYTPNGNLEFGKTDNWNAGGSPQIAISTAEKHSGNNALQVTGRTETWHSAQFNLLNSGMHTLKMTVQIDDEDNNNRRWETIASSSDTANWVKLSARYTYIPDGTATVFKVYFEADGKTSSYYIDDLLIVEVPVNIIKNGDMELGNTDNWNSAGAAQMATTEVEKYSGKYAMHVTGRSDTWHSAQYNLLNSGMQPGRTYDLSAWVKIADGVPDTIKMTVQIDDEDNNNRRWETIASSSDTANWVKIKTRYTYMPDGAATVFKVYFEAAGKISSYYIDDLVITEASESY